jgi:hypothetical protein
VTMLALTVPIVWVQWRILRRLRATRPARQ